MTKVFAFFFLLTISYMTAQEVDHTGTYFWSITPTNAGKHTRTLTINADNTFTFKNYREAWDLNPERTLEGTGTWTAKGKLIVFTTNPETELNKKYTLNFTNTKGRWDAKNNRLIMYESDISWLKRFTIQKQ